MRTILTYTTLAVLGPCVASSGAQVVTNSWMDWPITPQPVTESRDLAYGDHGRQVFDFWPANAPGEAGETPVVVFFHHGSFRSGSKNALPGYVIERFNKMGISVVAANYRFTNDAPLPGPMLDGARVVQFLRENAERYNVDVENVGAFGISAGAGISMWIAAHEDLADVESEDPVLRQSSRIRAAAAFEGQPSLDPKSFTTLFPALDMVNEPEFRGLYDLGPGEHETPRAQRMFDLASPITHLSADDPPIFMFYALSLTPMGRANRLYYAIHHPDLATPMVERAREVGVPFVLDVLGKERQSTAAYAEGELFELFANVFEIESKPEASPAAKPES